MKRIHLGILDDEILFRKGMELLIGDFEGIEIIIQAGHGQELLDRLRDTPQLPDIILLDLKMPVLNGIDTTEILVNRYSEIKVIVLSTYYSQSFVARMIELGAAAYLPKNSEPEEVERTLRAVSSKGFYYNDFVQETLRERLRQKKKNSPNLFDRQITPREKEVLQLICEQYTNSEIADKLFISNRTVDGHRNNLLQKFNCRNTAGLVAFAILEKYVEVDPTLFWRE